MTNFEKILLPLVVKNISKEDICPESGFIDTYTVDVDRPSWQNEFFIVYNDFIRSEKSINRARKFENSGNLKRVYVKCINNKPCIVYSFWIDRTLKKLYDDTFILNSKQKFKVAQFWGASDEIFDIVLDSTIQSSIEHKMPLADYQKSIGEKLKGITRQCYSLFYFFIIVEKVIDRIWNLFFYSATAPSIPAPSNPAPSIPAPSNPGDSICDLCFLDFEDFVSLPIPLIDVSTPNLLNIIPYLLV